MRYFKKYSGMLAVMCALLCVLLAVSACTGSGDDGVSTADTDAATGTPATDAPVQTAQETVAETQPADTKVTYTVRVVDQNGDPVVGAAVGLCDDSGCRMPSATDETGTVVFTFDPSNFHATVQECPDGYTADPEQAFYFPDGETTLTATITKN